MKFLLKTSAFIAGVVVDDKTKMVTSADPGAKQFVGCKLKDLEKYVKEHKWAMSPAE